MFGMLFLLQRIFLCIKCFAKTPDRFRYMAFCMQQLYDVIPGWFFVANICHHLYIVICQIALVTKSFVFFWCQDGLVVLAFDIAVQRFSILRAIVTPVHQTICKATIDLFIQHITICIISLHIAADDIGVFIIRICAF